MHYFFSYFRTVSESLYLAYSVDGISWTALNDNKAIFKCDIGNKSIRDPYIRRGKDGKFNLVFTNSWHSSYIAHAWSENLKDWNDLKLIPVMKNHKDCRNAWAPEFVYDKSTDQYYIFWSSVTGKRKKKYQRTWYTTTKDFVKFSDSKVLIDFGYSVIDPTAIFVDPYWYMIFKDERGKNIPKTKYKALKVVRSQKFEGLWEPVGEGYFTEHLVEGPCVFRKDDEYWCLYDFFMKGKYGGKRTKDFKNWRSLPGEIKLPKGPRHGTVFCVDDDVAKKIIANFQ